MALQRKFHTIPPTYFFSSILAIIILYFAMPAYLVIPFWYNLLGILPIAAGIWLNKSAKDAFVRHKTPHDYNQPVSIVNTGIFCRTRNPMYIGMFMALAGLAVLFGNLWGLFVPVVFMAIICIYFVPLEERAMRQIFGEEFELYCRQVRRWI